MTKRSKWLVASVPIVVLSGIGWLYFDWQDSSESKTLQAPHDQGIATPEIITPLPLSLLLDVRKVKLGEQLFNDPRLSGDGSVSCAHCHNLKTGGVDRLRFSRGVDGKEGTINAPTVFNSGFNFRQFWDGRADTLENQIDGPLQNPIEMNGTWPQAIATILADPAYSSMFSAIYRDGVQRNNIKDAVATFERSLVTPNSRFDRFLRGDRGALNENEKAGYELFKQIGCTSCHQGINIGGNMYQRLGLMEDFFAKRGNITEADLGRFNITKLERDRYFFKVPTLRNVAITPPYLHDGSAKTLEEAVNVMARYQLGIDLTTNDVNSVVAFLRTLTGEYSGKALE